MQIQIVPWLFPVMVMMQFHSLWNKISQKFMSDSYILTDSILCAGHPKSISSWTSTMFLDKALWVRHHHDLPLSWIAIQIMWLSTKFVYSWPVKRNKKNKKTDKDAVTEGGTASSSTKFHGTRFSTIPRTETQILATSHGACESCLLWDLLPSLEYLA